MFEVEEIKEIIEKYFIKNGEVIVFLSNKKVVDNDEVLKIKAARFIYNEAMEIYQNTNQEFGYSKGNIERYIENMMQRLAVHDEKNGFALNKMMYALLSSDGYCEVSIKNKTLDGTVYEKFLDKNSLGLAYLKMKFKSKGILVDNFKFSLDTSDWDKTRLSKLVITFDILNKEEPVIEDSLEEIEEVNEKEILKDLVDIDRGKKEKKKDFLKKNDNGSKDKDKVKKSKVKEISKVEVVSKEDTNYQDIKIDFDELKIEHQEDIVKMEKALLELNKAIKDKDEIMTKYYKDTIINVLLLNGCKELAESLFEEN